MLGGSGTRVTTSRAPPTPTGFIASSGVKPFGRLVGRKWSFLIFRFIGVAQAWALRDAVVGVLSHLFPLPSALRL